MLLSQARAPTFVSHGCAPCRWRQQGPAPRRLPACLRLLQQRQRIGVGSIVQGGQGCPLPPLRCPEAALPLQVGRCRGAAGGRAHSAELASGQVSLGVPQQGGPSRARILQTHMPSKRDPASRPASAPASAPHPCSSGPSARRWCWRAGASGLQVGRRAGGKGSAGKERKQRTQHAFARDAAGHTIMEHTLHGTRAATPAAAAAVHGSHQPGPSRGSALSAQPPAPEEKASMAAPAAACQSRRTSCGIISYTTSRASTCGSKGREPR